MTAPICPTSHTETRPLPKTIVDAIRGIPRATDLRSAITALNRINNILIQISRMPPQINNTVNPRGAPGASTPGTYTPGTNTPGTVHGQQYGPANWLEEARVYEQLSLINPDDNKQKIDIKVLARVTFRNPNTDFRLTYHS